MFCIVTDCTNVASYNKLHKIVHSIQLSKVALYCLKHADTRSIKVSNYCINEMCINIAEYSITPRVCRKYCHRHRTKTCIKSERFVCALCPDTANYIKKGLYEPDRCVLHSTSEYILHTIQTLNQVPQLRFCASYKCMNPLKPPYNTHCQTCSNPTYVTEYLASIEHLDKSDECGFLSLDQIHTFKVPQFLFRTYDVREIMDDAHFIAYLRRMAHR